jgi:lactobin A/cerein 7B family class IIb bacteriocin
MNYLVELNAQEMLSVEGGSLWYYIGGGWAVDAGKGFAAGFNYY